MQTSSDRVAAGDGEGRTVALVGLVLAGHAGRLLVDQGDRRTDDLPRPPRASRPHPVVGLQRHHRVTADLGDGRQRLDPGVRLVQGGHRGRPRPRPTTSTRPAGSTAARSSSTATTTGTRAPRTSRPPRPVAEGLRHGRRLLASRTPTASTVLAANPQVPNVTVSLSQAASDLPNSFSPDPAANGWQIGAAGLLQEEVPRRRHARRGPGRRPAVGHRQVERREGGHGVRRLQGRLRPEFDITTTDFTQNVVAMRNDGVKILFLEQMPENYAGIGGEGPQPAELPSRSGLRCVDLLRATGTGLRRRSGHRRHLHGADQLAVPGRGRQPPSGGTAFQTWVQKAAPGFKPDLYTLFGWLSAELFTQALQAAGKNPTRGSVLQQLRKITIFNGNYLIATSNPAKKIPANCYVIAQIKRRAIQRVDDPPVNGLSTATAATAVLLRQVAAVATAHPVRRPSPAGRLSRGPRTRSSQGPRTHDPPDPYRKQTEAELGVGHRGPPPVVLGLPRRVGGQGPLRWVPERGGDHRMGGLLPPDVHEPGWIDPYAPGVDEAFVVDGRREDERSGPDIGGPPSADGAGHSGPPAGRRGPGRGPRPTPRSTRSRPGPATPGRPPASRCLRQVVERPERLHVAVGVAYPRTGAAPGTGRCPPSPRRCGPCASGPACRDR